MPVNQIADKTLRAQLHSDIQTAWTGSNLPQKIYDGRPRLQKAKADLPYAVITLTQFQQPKAGLLRVTQTYTYEIALVQLWSNLPASTSIEDYKVDLANALIAVLTLNRVYAGIGRERQIMGADFGEGQTPEDNEPVFEVSVTFQVTVDDVYSTT